MDKFIQKLKILPSVSQSLVPSASPAVNTLFNTVQQRLKSVGTNLSSAAHKTLSQIDFSQVQDDADK
jgi:hypothetical protein